MDWLNDLFINEAKPALNRHSASGSGDGVTIKNQDKTVIENGSYKADSGYTGLGTVTVAVPQEEPVLQDKIVTENGTVTADSGYDGLGVVTVNVETSGGGDEVLLSMLENTITEFSNDAVTVLGESAFHNKTSLTKVILRNLEAIGSKAFYGCISLVEVIAPNCVSVLADAFNNTKIISFDAPLTGIATKAFAASALRYLFLRNSTAVCTMAYTNCFGNTSFASNGTGGAFFVPSSLRDSYANATNWAAILAYEHNKLLNLEDYTIDGTVTGEIDWDKVNTLFA